jgi:WD40 repeat protein
MHNRTVESGQAVALGLAAVALALVTIGVTMEGHSTSPVVQARVLLRDLTSEGEFISEVLLSADDRWLAVRIAGIPRDPAMPAHVGRTILFGTRSRKLRLVDEAHYYNSMCFSPMSKSLFVVNLLGRIVEHELATGRQRFVVDNEGRAGQTQGKFTAVSVDGKMIAVGHSLIVEPQINAFDVATGNRVEFQEGKYLWTGATISRNGRLVATGGWPGWSPRIFDRVTKEWVGYCLHDDYLGPGCIAFTPDARHLACTYPDGTLAVYDVATAQGGGAKQVLELPDFENVTCLSFNHDGRRLVCGLRDGSVETRTIRIP